MPDKEKAKKKRSSGRATVLAGLLAVVALVAMWLSDCIPGFGIGAGTKDGEGEKAEDKAEPESKQEAKPEPTQPQPEAASGRKPMPMKLTIDARGCLVNGAEPIDCKTLCDEPELFDGVEAVIIDAENGPHEVVVDVLDCLKQNHLAVSITRK